MRLPIQAKPVKRPELIHPHTTLDIKDGDAAGRLSIRSRLTYGANYNDPPALHMPICHWVKLPCSTRAAPGWF